MFTFPAIAFFANHRAFRRIKTTSTSRAVAINITMNLSVAILATDITRATDASYAARKISVIGIVVTKRWSSI